MLLFNIGEMKGDGISSTFCRYLIPERKESAQRRLISRQGTQRAVGGYVCSSSGMMRLGVEALQLEGGPHRNPPRLPLISPHGVVGLRAVKE